MKEYDWDVNGLPREWMVEFVRWRHHIEHIQRESVTCLGKPDARSYDNMTNQQETFTVWEKCKEKRLEYMMWSFKCREKQREYKMLLADCHAIQQTKDRLLAEAEAIREYIKNFRSQELQ